MRYVWCVCVQVASTFAATVRCIGAMPKSEQTTTDHRKRHRIGRVLIALGAVRRTPLSNSRFTNSEMVVLCIFAAQQWMWRVICCHKFQLVACSWAACSFGRMAAGCRWSTFTFCAFMSAPEDVWILSVRFILFFFFLFFIVCVRVCLCVLLQLVKCATEQRNGMCAKHSTFRLNQFWLDSCSFFPLLSFATAEDNRHFFRMNIMDHGQ